MRNKYIDFMEYYRYGKSSNFKGAIKFLQQVLISEFLKSGFSVNIEMNDFGHLNIFGVKSYKAMSGETYTIQHNIKFYSKKFANIYTEVGTCAVGRTVNISADFSTTTKTKAGIMYGIKYLLFIRPMHTVSEHIATREASSIKRKVLENLNLLKPVK